MSDERAYYCHDPLQPYEAKHTDSSGILTPGGAGDFTVSSPTTAQELRAKYPQMLIREHPRYMTQGKSQRRASFVMPALPYETEYDRKRKAKLAHEPKTT